MSTITLAIIIVFVIGYMCIALETLTKVNKAAIALLMLVACWTLYMFDPGNFPAGITSSGIASVAGGVIEGHLGSTATTLFFLMGAMTIVETVDQYGGFNFVRNMLKTQSKRGLLWRITIMTFFLSAILDNMTTAIVMVMILRKLVSDHKDRLIYASLVIIAANSGGAFSPIGLSLSLKGNLAADTGESTEMVNNGLTESQRKIVFWVGVGGLIFVPIFKSITHVPPFVGILLVLGALWLVTELFYRSQGEHAEGSSTQKRISNIISRIDMSTILFFLGILMAVSCLQEIGVLATLGEGLNDIFDGNHYLITGIIGVLSSIIDNVPLVAGCMGMYPLAEVGDMAQDGIFWQLLAYCAGVGGSMLIIGSAAGVVVMGLEKITFGWYMKRITWIAFVGYVAGILVYWVEKSVLGL